MPNEMRPQLAFIEKIVPLLGFASLSLPNTEADDLMASYSCAAIGMGHEVVLATNDKDLFQLVCDGVKIYTTNKTDFASPKDTFALLGCESVQKKWGVNPEQIGDVLSLIGDSVDNIPGVPGLGAKGAATLLQTHGSIDALLANIEAVKPERTREKLREARERIVQNREMVRLDTDLALPLPLEELRYQPRYPELLAALEWCEFKSLMDELKAEAPRPTVVAQGELF
jgi:DNA polymerase-1